MCHNVRFTAKKGELFEKNCLLKYGDHGRVMEQNSSQAYSSVSTSSTRVNRRIIRFRRIIRRQIYIT